VEFKTVLGPGDWSPLGEDHPAQSSQLTVDDDLNNSDAQRFYRVTQLP
jgi:hypothetical protein